MDELRQTLGVGDRGLSGIQVLERQQVHGPNELKARERHTVAGLFLRQFQDLMIIVLLFAAIIAGIVGDTTDTIIILAIVLVNAVIGVVQEHRAERALEALRRLSAPVATVQRDGVVMSIPARELVPGDVVYLEAGQVVPADIRFTVCHRLRIQEAALTGESHDIT